MSINVDLLLVTKPDKESYPSVVIRLGGGLNEWFEAELNKPHERRVHFIEEDASVVHLEDLEIDPVRKEAYDCKLMYIRTKDIPDIIEEIKEFRKSLDKKTQKNYEDMLKALKFLSGFKGYVILYWT